MQIAYFVIDNFDFILPIDPEYEILSFLSPQKDKIILDIGAHKGESIRSFRIYDKSSPILSIEANSDHEPCLKKLQKKYLNVDYKIISASDSEKPDYINVPYYQGFNLSAWSSNSQEESFKIFYTRSFLTKLESKLKFRSIPVQSIPLDNYNLEPFIIKIDVEGTEARILTGLKTTIQKHSPIIIVENNNIDEIKTQLDDFGYKPYVYDSKPKILKDFDNQTNINIVFLNPKFFAYDLLVSRIFKASL
jgi:FkbM family methyltransferase